jgi:hypothetical protein
MTVPHSEKQTNTKTNRVSVVMVTSETDVGCYPKQLLYKTVGVELLIQNGAKSSVGRLYYASAQIIRPGIQKFLNFCILFVTYI